MRVEAGKFYKTRDGRKEGPIEYNPKIINHGKFFCGSRYWTLCGHVYGARVPCGGDLIAEWTDEPRPWGELTDAEEVGRIVIAHRKDRYNVQVLSEDGEWLKGPVSLHSHLCYRLAPEPVVETVTLYGSANIGFGSDECADCTSRITFDVIDGVPDVSSVKMEEIENG